MNTKMLKGMTAAVSLLTGIGAASQALASSTGQQALVGGNSIDVWTFTCPAAAQGAKARVLDNGPNNPAGVQVVLGQDGNPTGQAADTEGGGASAVVTVAEGSGGYAMAFKKTGGGNEGYIGEVFCFSGALLSPVSSLTRRINQ